MYYNHGRAVHMKREGRELISHFIPHFSVRLTEEVIVREL